MILNFNVSEVIHKYQLYPDQNGNCILRLCKGSDILCVQEQRGFLCIWVKYDPSMTLIDYTFKVLTTGNPIPEFTGKYIGTVQLDYGLLVFHIFQTNNL